jgi:hypothetical protein
MRARRTWRSSRSLRLRPPLGRRLRTGFACVPRAAYDSRRQSSARTTRPPSVVDSWAVGNRIWCEFVHGKWRARHGEPTRNDRSLSK